MIIDLSHRRLGVSLQGWFRVLPMGANSSIRKPQVIMAHLSCKVPGLETSFRKTPTVHNGPFLFVDAVVRMAAEVPSAQVTRVGLSGNAKWPLCEGIGMSASWKGLSMIWVGVWRDVRRLTCLSRDHTQLKTARADSDQPQRAFPVKQRHIQPREAER